MSLLAVTRALHANLFEVRAARVSLARVGEGLAHARAAFDPTATVEVGPGSDASAEFYQRLFTRGPSIGASPIDEAVARFYQRLFFREGGVGSYNRVQAEVNRRVFTRTTNVPPPATGLV